MSAQEFSAAAAQLELERIILRMQAIQQTIKASRQPASMLELEELKSLGRDYARIIDRLANPAGDQLVV